MVEKSEKARRIRHSMSAHNHLWPDHLTESIPDVCLLQTAHNKDPEHILMSVKLTLQVSDCVLFSHNKKIIQ